MMVMKDICLMKSQKKKQNPASQNGFGHNNMLISALLKINLRTPEQESTDKKLNTNLCGIDFEEDPRDIPSHQDKDTTEPDMVK